jgi:hypothetical protein
VLITPSLGVPNWPVNYIINTAPPTNFLAPLLGNEEEEEAPTTRQQNINKFFGVVAGEKEDFYKGSFAWTSFTLFKFALLYFCLHHFYQKHKKISFLIVVTLLLLVYYVVP